MVYVLNQNGQPLMPTENHAKVRVLLKQGKVKVVNKCPFTIQLLYSSTNYTQKVTLGVDSGSKHIGISATTKNKVLFESDVELRNDIVDLISTRRELRLLDGTHINASVGYKNLKLLKMRSSYLIEQRKVG